MINIRTCKRIAILLPFLSFPFSANAAGPYDGVWELIIPGVSGLYATINQTGDTMALITLDVNDGAWHAYSGQLQGTQAEMSTVISGHNSNLVYVLEFSSTTEGTLTQISCTPISVCNEWELPNNVPFSYLKVF